MNYKNCEIVVTTEDGQWSALVIRGVTLEDIKATGVYNTREQAVEAAKSLIDGVDHDKA